MEPALLEPGYDKVAGMGVAVGKNMGGLYGIPTPIVHEICRFTLPQSGPRRGGVFVGRFSSHSHGRRVPLEYGCAQVDLDARGFLA